MRRIITQLTSACALGVLAWSSSQAADLTTTNVVGSNTGWNTANIWRDSTGAIAGNPSPGNTYQCIFNGTPFGNNTANTRMRNLYASSSPLYQTFPGDSLTLNTNTEFRFKRISSSSIPTVNFPGVDGNPGLILNGGVINVGDDMVCPIDGKIYAVPGSVSLMAMGDNGAGSTVRNNRTFNIIGELSGSGTIVIFQSPGANPEQISGNANTFSGNWIVQAGWLQGVGANSLGTGNITLDPSYAVPLDPAAMANVTLFPGPAILEPMYDMNTPGTLTIINGGQMRLHQNCAFTAVTIEGIALSAGTHYYAELTQNYPGNFAAGGSGALTVQPYGTLPILFETQPLPQMLYAGGTAHFTAAASGGGGPLTYQWRKNGGNLSDGGNIAGATTPTLTVSSVLSGDAGNYDVVVSDGTKSSTSTQAALTVVNPSGEAYEAAVIAADPAVFYQLNETTDPASGTARAFDYAGGGIGTYGTGVQNGNPAYSIAGPNPSAGFTGFNANNTAAQFVNLTPTSRVTVSPWNLNTNVVTLTAWIKPSALQAANAGIVFCRGGGTTAGLNYSGNLDLLGNPTLGYRWNNEWETYSWDSGIVPPADQWSLVSLVVTPDQATIYLMNANGLLQSTHVYSHVLQSFAGTTLIGDDPNNNDGTRVFSGTIDDVAVFSYALTKAQLVALYETGLGSSPAYAPIIAQQPVASQSLYAGQTATFRVVAGGSDPVSYQWKKAPYGSTAYANLSDGAGISGSTTPTLVIENIVDADGADYIVTISNGAGSTNSAVASLYVIPASPAENITMSVQQAAGTDWENGPDWSDYQAASVSAVMKPGSTYECLPGARLRTPEAPRTAVFPGDVLTMDGEAVWINNPGAGSTMSEIRFKQPNPGRVIFPRLVMNGGQLDAGNNGIIEIGGLIEVRTNAPFYNDSGNDRGFLITAQITGDASIEYHAYNQSAFMSNYVNNLNIACPTNTFTGTWNVALGTLLGTAPGCLGTNDIMVGPQGAIETTYDINNPDANLFLSGRMYLHQHHTFKSLFVNGVPLEADDYTFAQLNAAYPDNFPAEWMPQTGATNYTSGSGSITVLYTPAPIIVQQPASLSLYPTETAQFTVEAQGLPPLGYRWRKDGFFLTDSGNISGSLTTNLVISDITSADAGEYDVIVTNSLGSATSEPATLTLLPTGPAMDLTLDYGGLPIVQPTGSDWNTPDNWSDGNPASLSALANPGSTYTVPAGARLRSPVGGVNSVFPGNILTVAGDGVWLENSTTAGEIRFKHANQGTNYFKKLVMNGGQLDSGDNGLLVIAGEMNVLANAPIYTDAAAGQDRPWQIDAWLTGDGSVEYHALNNSFSVNLNITGATNTFSGTWNIVQGVLLGSAPGSLGTNQITIGADGALETLYDINNAQGTLILDGQMFLHQNDRFRSVVVAGTTLADGVYSFAQLNAAYPANFPATWPLQMGSTVNTGSGSITVGAAAPQIPLEFEFNGSTLHLSWSQGILLEADDLKGPWRTNSTTSPVDITPTDPQKFFKLLVQ